MTKQNFRFTTTQSLLTREDSNLPFFPFYGECPTTGRLIKHLVLTLQCLDFDVFFTFLLLGIVVPFVYFMPNFCTSIRNRTYVVPSILFVSVVNYNPHTSKVLLANLKISGVSPCTEFALTLGKTSY